MSIYLTYLICSCSVSHKARNWPSKFWVGQLVHVQFLYKNTITETRYTYEAACTHFSRLCLFSHIQCMNYQKIKLGLRHFWCWNLILEGALRIEALAVTWNLECPSFGCVYFCFMKRIIIMNIKQTMLVYYWNLSLGIYSLNFVC